MTTARRRAAAIAAIAAAFTAAMALPGPVLADEEPVVSIDGTICYEVYKDDKPTFTARLSEKSEKDVVVVVHTEDGSAQSPKDYQGSDRLVVVIPAGQTRVEVPLEIVDDGEKEPDEYFLVVVDAAYGAVIGNDKAEIIIKDGAPPQQPGK